MRDSDRERDEVCPCCGRPLEGKPLQALRSQLRGNQLRLLNAIVRQPGSTTSELAAVVYEDDPEGGPDNYSWGIGALVKVTNRTLRPMGWELRAHPHHGYHLRRLP